MATSLLLTTFPLPGVGDSLRSGHIEIDSGFAIPGFVDTIKTNGVVADSEVSDSGTGTSEIDSREIFTGTSLRESFLVGRDSGNYPVEGQTLLGNPMYINTLPAPVGDPGGYGIILSNRDDILESPIRETDKIPNARLRGARGRRGGEP